MAGGFPSRVPLCGVPGVPDRCWVSPRKVIAPEEIVDPNVDEHSVMTYLSQFPKAKLRPGAPLRPRPPQPGRARAYGPGMGG